MNIEAPFESFAADQVPLSQPLRWFDAAMPTKEALPRAVNAMGAVPTGWTSLLEDTMTQLLAVRTKEREFSLLFMSPDIDDGTLCLDIPFADRVMAGIARRCAERSKEICQLCSKRGKRRYLGMYEVVTLCPQCAAVELLHRGIVEAEKYIGIYTIDGTVPGLRLLPDVLRQRFVEEATAKCPMPPGQEPRMDKNTFRAWVSTLNGLRPFLPPPRLKERRGGRN